MFNINTKEVYNKGSGYVALISILVTSAIGVALTVSVILLGIASSRTSFTAEQSSQAKALANACIGEALQQIHDTNNFTGSNGLSLGQGSCTYTVTIQGGQNRTVTSTGIIGSIIRKVKVIVSAVNPAIQLTSWQELADF